MNPEHKREYSMHKVKAFKFRSVDEIRDRLTELLPCDFRKFGYIEPGHGLKGRSQWISDEEDLESMYDK